jgi:hypothetical protein
VKNIDLARVLFEGVTGAGDGDAADVSFVSDVVLGDAALVGVVATVAAVLEFVVVAVALVCAVLCVLLEWFVLLVFAVALVLPGRLDDAVVDAVVDVDDDAEVEDGFAFDPSWPMLESVKTESTTKQTNSHHLSERHARVRPAHTHSLICKF